MTRRQDYIDTVRLVLAMDRSHVPSDALRVLQLAYGLPDESFPPVTAHDVEHFCRYGRGETAYGPEWVVAALEDRRAAEATTAEPTVYVVMENVQAGEWVENVRNLMFRDGGWSWGDVPGGVCLLNGRGVMPASEYRRVVEWARGIPGYDEEDPPFTCVTREEYEA